MKLMRLRFCSISFYLPFPIGKDWEKTSQTTTGSPDNRGLTDMAGLGEAHVIREKQGKNDIWKMVLGSQRSWPFRKSCYSLPFFVYLLVFTR